MKKTWKQLLGTLASGAMLGTVTLGTLMGPVFGQSEDDGVVVLGQGAPQAVTVPTSADEGTVQLGGMYGPPASMPYVEDAPHGYAAPDSHDPTIHPGGVYGAETFATPVPYAPAGSAIGYAVTQDPEDIMLRVGRRNGDVYGVDEGYTTLGGFLTRHEDANTVWFFNPRLLLTDQGRGGLNLGFGQKAFYPDLDRVVSLSAWWDYDSGHHADYQQVGVSFEMIGQNLSLRSNANFLITRNEESFGAMNIGAPIVTDDGSMIQFQRIFNEVAYNQADVELAAPMPLAAEWGWEWAAGAYFLFGGDGRDATGVKGRIESQVTEDLWVNAVITSDRVFDTNVSVNLEFTIPHAPPSKWWRRPTVRDHLWAAIRRYDRVATAVVERQQATPVMVMGNNGAMQPLRLGLIDPNITDDPLQAFGGSGTLADPWLSVADYSDEPLDVQQQFGIIAVRRRVDDSDLNLNTTIVLLNNQALLGEGVMHSLDGVNPIDIPALATSGVPRPMLTNSEAPGQDVVTLANNNQVAGFQIDAGGTANGIVGDGISGFNINQIAMTNVIDGIRIRHASAPGGSLGIIRDNVITGLGLGSPRGISIEHQGGTLRLLVSNNTVSNFQGEDANSNGILDPSEDVNNNLVLDPGEDIDFDGRLDLSEDLNMNGVLDAGFGIYLSAANGSTILANSPLNPLIPLGILDNTLDMNGTGLSVAAFGGSTIIANVERNLATGSTDLGEDANGNMLLDFGEDLNGNGVLDFGSGFNVLSNASTINFVTFRDNAALNGAGNGATFQTIGGGAISVVNPAIDPATLLPALAFTTNLFNGNALDGMFVRADNGSILFDQIQNSEFSMNGDDGLDLETANGGSIFIRDPLLGNTFTNNGDNGLEVTGGAGGGVTLSVGDPTGAGLANIIMNNGTNRLAANRSGIFLGTVGGLLTASFSGLTSTGNSGSGAILFLDGGTIRLDGIQNNVFTGNLEHGLVIDNNNGGTLITPFVADNDFSNNGLAGLFLTGFGPGNGLGTTGTTDLGSVTRNNFNRDVTGTEGILIDASDQRIIATLTRNSFVGRLPMGADPGAGRGIGGTISGTTTLPAPGGLTFRIGTVVPADANTFMNNGDAHIGLEMLGNTTNFIGVDNGTFNNAFDIPSTVKYGGEGIHYILGDTARLTGFVTNSMLSGNEGDGLLIEIAGNNDAGNTQFQRAAELNSFVIADNTITNNGILNAAGGVVVSSSGINIQRTERGQFNDLLIDSNIITGNTENGITIASLHANQLNLFNMRADTVMITNNEIRNNLEDGIELTVGADADMAARLDNNLITMNGFNASGVNVTGNGNGIEVRERTQTPKDSRTLTGLWTNNIITDNFDDGIDISGFMGNQLTELTEAGVYTIAPPAPGTTFPSLGLVRSYGLVIGDIMINPIGIIDEDMNLISRNGGDGVDVTGGGTATIGNNVITENGTLDAQGRVRHAGINIDGSELGPGQSTAFDGEFPIPDDDVNFNITAYREMFIISNLISRNIGDGIELLTEPSVEFILSATSPDVTETALTIVNNEITLNAGRGIDILQRTADQDNLDRDNEDPDGIATVFDLLGGFNTDVTITGNHIKGNALEGIYVVQTVDGQQNQVDRSEASGPNGESLSAQGDQSDMNDTPRLRLDVHDNFVIGNGNAIIDFPASGLVIRVGTSGGFGLFNGSSPFAFRASNFFATSGFNLEDLDGDGILDNDLDGDGFLDAGPVTGAGISTSITGNVFDGNFGDDVLLQSFTDTVAPPTAGGAWDDMMFTPMGFQTDPLSRLDVILSLNRFNSFEANNLELTIGTSPGNAGIAQAGAFYDDDDPVFKSRDVMQMPLPGPFINGTRRRNATRFASRYISGPFVLPPDPLISPDMGDFAYPGMGNSTLRVRGQGNFYTDGHLLGVVTLDQFFIFDDPALVGDPDLVDSTIEANGVFALPNNSMLPWGWDVLEPGTPPTP